MNIESAELSNFDHNRYITKYYRRLYLTFTKKHNQSIYIYSTLPNSNLILNTAFFFRQRPKALPNSRSSAFALFGRRRSGDMLLKVTGALVRPQILASNVPGSFVAICG